MPSMRSRIRIVLSTDCSSILRLPTHHWARRFFATSYLRFAAAKVIGLPRLRSLSRLIGLKRGLGIVAGLFVASPTAAILQARLPWQRVPWVAAKHACL